MFRCLKLQYEALNDSIKRQTIQTTNWLNLLNIEIKWYILFDHLKQVQLNYINYNLLTELLELIVYLQTNNIKLSVVFSSCTIYSGRCSTDCSRILFFCLLESFLIHPYLLPISVFQKILQYKRKPQIQTLFWYHGTVA